jgi:hypothetical protein
MPPCHPRTITQRPPFPVNFESQCWLLRTGLQTANLSEDLHVIGTDPDDAAAWSCVHDLCSYPYDLPQRS